MSLPIRLFLSDWLCLSQFHIRLSIFVLGHWPIPESFWPDLKLTRLPPRHAHPILKFSCSPCEPMVVENLPFDKYELEPSPLTQFILERKQPHICWQVLWMEEIRANRIYLQRLYSICFATFHELVHRIKLIDDLATTRFSSVPAAEKLTSLPLSAT